MTALAFYAHKGGVGKSTLAFEIGQRVAATGMPVVYLDADSQVNTTFKLLHRCGVPVNDALIASMLSPKTSDSSDGTLYTYLSGQQPVPTFSIDHFRRLPGIPGEIRFLNGSPKLHELETQLTLGFSQPQYNPLAAGTLLNFFNLLRSIKAYYRNKVLILVDLSPSASLLNQNILLACDRFVLPCTPDEGSMVSLHLLLHYLDQWQKSHTYLHAVKPPVQLLCAVLNCATGTAACEGFQTRIQRALAGKAVDLLTVEAGVLGEAMVLTDEIGLRKLVEVVSPKPSAPSAPSDPSARPKRQKTTPIKTSGASAL